MDNLDLKGKLLKKPSSVSAKELLKLSLSDDQTVKDIVQLEIKSRFNKRPFKELMEHASEFILVDNDYSHKTKWKDYFRNKIKQIKNDLTSYEWADLIASQKWFFENNLSLISTYVNQKIIKSICNDNPECFANYDKSEFFIKKYLSLDERLEVDFFICQDDVEKISNTGLLGLISSGNISKILLRRELRRRMDQTIPFFDFIQAASEFNTEDPENKTEWLSHFNTRIEIDMKNKSISILDWAHVIEKHQWFFNSDIIKIEEKVPHNYLSKLCHDNREYFTGYKGSQQFVEKHKERYEKDKQEELRNDFINSAIILDLEYDSSLSENKIKQICYSHNGRSRELKPSSEKELEAFLVEMAQNANGCWLIGHNIIGWDLPKMREVMQDQAFLVDCPVWDTLVVQTLLEPWLVSQALVGAEMAHDAMSDVEATHRLLEKQIDVLKPNFDSLGIKFSSPLSVVEQICEILSQNPLCRQPPKGSSYVEEIIGSIRPTLLPEAIIGELQWVPNVRFDQRVLKRGREQIDSNGNAFSDTMSAIAELVIDNLTNYASSQEIELIPTMMPAWIVAQSRELAERKCPEASNVKYRSYKVCTYEALADLGFDTFDPDAWFEPFVELRQVSLIQVGSPLSRNPILDHDEPDELTAKRLIGLPSSCRNGSLVGFSDKKHLWIEYHPSRKKAPNPWNLLDATYATRASSNIDGLSVKRNNPLLQIPILFDDSAKENTVERLYSMAASDRFASWKDLVLTVKSILAFNVSVVHVVLLQDFQEHREADELFKELGWAPGLGRKRFQRLSSLRGKEAGKCLVGVLKDARYWQKAAERCGVKVAFIIPELPIDRWALAIRSETKAAPENSDELVNDNHLESEDDEESENTTDPRGDDPDEQVTEVPTNNDQTSGDDRNRIKFLSSWDRLRAASAVLPRWMELTFPEQIPWILDPCVIEACPPGFLKKVKIPLRNLDDSEFIKVADQFPERMAKDRDESKHTIEHYQKWHRKLLRKADADFYPDQRVVIDEVLKNERDVFVALPTGGGKSNLFQIPALIEGRSTGKLSIVISPLKALMKEQVEKLQMVTFEGEVDYLSSDLDPWALSEANQAILDGKTMLLYVAPERFRNPRFRSYLSRRCQNDKGLAHVIIDEAHCVWLWGLEFRPDYFYALDYLRKMRDQRGQNGSYFRFFLFSATVTGSVFSNVSEVFQKGNAGALIRCPKEHRHPVRDVLQLFTRRMNPERKAVNWSERLEQRCNLIADSMSGINPKKSVGLLFVSMRQQADDCRDSLARRMPDEIIVEAFHAGLSTRDRNCIQGDLTNGKVHMLAATKAFGMGMDIPNIHRSFHLSPPLYLEDYLQEVGRSGRGAKELKEAELKHVDCSVFWDRADLERNRKLVKRNNLTLADLELLRQSIEDHSYETTNGRVAVVLPSKALGMETDTRLRSALGWLERAPLRRIDIIQSLPHILELKIASEFGDKTAMLGIRESSGFESFRSLLQEIINPCSKDSLASMDSRFLGICAEPNAGDEKWRRVILNVREVVIELNLGSFDEVYFYLQKFIEVGAIQQCQQLEFTRARNWSDHEILVNAGKELLAFILSDQIHSSKTYEKIELCNLAKDKLSQAVSKKAQLDKTNPPKEEGRNDSLANQTDHVIFNCERMASKLVEALIKSARARVVGVMVIEKAGGDVENSHTVTFRPQRDEREPWGEVWNIAESLAHSFQDPSTFMPWNDMIKLSVGTNGRRKVQAALGILRSLGLIHFDPSLNSTAYLVKIVEVEIGKPERRKLLGIDHKPIRGSFEETVEGKLKECNEFNRLREMAMELWLQIPDPEKKRIFIDEYFKVENADGLRILLSENAGQLEEESKVEFLKTLAQEELEKRLEELMSPEPNQYKACTWPYQENLLINAGPGAGKTKVLLLRAAYLIHYENLNPEQILILAFNRAVVNEIRRELRRLFEALGYGSYVGGLQAHTFHSLAIKHMPDSWDQLKRAGSIKEGKRRISPIEQLLRKFMEDIKSPDGKTASKLSMTAFQGFKAVLVDEFQDMNEERSNLIRSIKIASGASIMAIGDDDQDILRWDRQGNAKHACEYFREFIEAYGVKDMGIALRINFRSCKLIVDESQRLLKEWLGIDGSKERQKKDIPLEANCQEVGIFDKFQAWSEGIERALEEARIGSCAVLCRSNAEALAAYAEIRELDPENVYVRLLGGPDLIVGRLRHCAVMIDLIRKNPEWINRSLESCWIEAANEFNNSLEQPIPEKIDTHRLSLLHLKEAFLEQDPDGGCEKWCDWLESLKVSEAEHILAEVKDRDGRTIRVLTVATIHKVKGLEFDSVVIMPSTAKFPFDDAKDQAVDDNALNIGDKSSRADEARLYYVGLTRARNRVWLGWGEREKSWSSGEDFVGDAERRRMLPLLTGSPSEVWLGYASYDPKDPKSTWSSEDVHRRIEKDIKVNSPILLRKRDSFGRYCFAFRSGPCVDNVGKTAHKKNHENEKSAIKTTSLRILEAGEERRRNMRLEVAAIYRQPFDPNSEEDKEQWSDFAKKRGWCYAVLVREIVGLEHTEEHLK